MEFVKEKAIRELVRSYNQNASPEFIQKIDEKVKELVKAANQRAELNGRKTIYGRDL